MINIEKLYDTIKTDIENNQEDVFNIQEVYNRKYSSYSDILNDVNVGLFYNDNLQPVVQIFIRNKSGYVKSHLIFNKKKTQIINTNYKIKKIND